MNAHAFACCTSLHFTLIAASLLGVSLTLVSEARALQIVTTTADSGAGSLRQMIASAAAVDTITFDNTLSGQTIVLTSGELLIGKNLSVDASDLAGGITINGNAAWRIFEFASNTTNTLVGLILTNGYSIRGCGILLNSGSMLTISNSTLTRNGDHGDFFGDGGGVYNDGGDLTLNNSTLADNYVFGDGGGIYNGGTLVLNTCTLSHNAAPQSHGGGVYSVGTLVLNNCTLSQNPADGGGGVYNLGNFTISNCYFTLSEADSSGGGGIASGGTGTINSSIFTQQRAEGAGAIDNWGSSLVISNCTFFDNSGAEGPGAIANSGTLTLNNCTLYGNRTGGTGSGGAIENWSGTLLLNNCTIYGNSAYWGGGGIDAYSGKLTLNNCTLSGNSAGTYGGGIRISTGTLTLNNSIVAGNTATNGPNISGTFSGANNLTNGNPLLAPLGYYGGPTQTMPPLPGCPAIDAGGPTSLTTDQRGFPRLSGAHVDIGAVEVQTAPVGNPPSLRRPTRGTDGSITFSFINVPMADFTVLVSTNVFLPMSQWIILGKAVQIVPGQYQFTDPAATNYPLRCYRVVSP
jgi:hypothetical protein